MKTRKQAKFLKEITDKIDGQTQIFTGSSN